ncbi:MAG: hypothetical protein IJX64_03210 [Clostridia bacterium]|nr:hypothetical protein [Clostridia bacterium]
MDGKDLILDFADGFWMESNSEHNPGENTVRTSASQIRFANFEVETLYVYKEIRMFGKKVMTTRNEMTLQTFIDNVNSKVWKPEIIHNFRKSRTSLLNGWISHQSRQYLEFEFSMYSEDVSYFWNDLCEDRIW